MEKLTLEQEYHRAIDRCNRVFQAHPQAAAEMAQAAALFACAMQLEKLIHIFTPKNEMEEK